MDNEVRNKDHPFLAKICPCILNYLLRVIRTTLRAQSSWGIGFLHSHVCQSLGCQMNTNNPKFNLASLIVQCILCCKVSRCWDELSRRMHTGWVGEGARESGVAPHHHHHRHHCSLVLKLTQCALLHHLSPCQGDYLHHCNIPQGFVLICAQLGGPM